MRVEYDPRFKDDMVKIWRYIAKDSKPRADRFKDEVKVRTAALVDFPYKFRQSIYFDDPDIRDLVVKGYVLPYKIDKDTITILGITKYKKEF